VVMANRDPDHNSHSTGDLSWLIAGGGARLATGQSLRWPSGTPRKDVPHARLLATLCTAVGVSPEGFTDEAPLREALGRGCPLASRHSGTSEGGSTKGGMPSRGRR